MRLLFVPFSLRSLGQFCIALLLGLAAVFVKVLGGKHHLMKLVVKFRPACQGRFRPQPLTILCEGPGPPRWVFILHFKESHLTLVCVAFMDKGKLFNLGQFVRREEPV